MVVLRIEVFYLALVVLAFVNYVKLKIRGYYKRITLIGTEQTTR